MKICLSFVIFLFLACGALTVFSQEQPDVYRHFTGIVKDRENQPLAGARVCGWDLSGRPLGGRIPCIKSQANGSFELGIPKWAGDTYCLWAGDFEKGYIDPFLSALYEKSLLNQSIEVNGINESNPVEIRLTQKAGRMFLNLIDDTSGQMVEKGSVTVCRVDDPDACQSTSTSFPNGVYEFLTPKAAFNLKMKWWDGSEWKDYIVMDENLNLIETLQVELGKSKKMTIRLRK